MAATIGNFRSALHGFNRNDVVQFIQSQTMEHERVLRASKEENSRLQTALEEARKELTACQEELASAQAALEEAKCADADFSPAEPAAEGLDAPMASPVTVVSAATNDFNEMELAAYRRAEMTERMARERAAASAERMKAIFSQADEKLLLTSQDLATLMDAFRSDFEQMQQLLSTAQGIVNESSEGLKAATDLCEEA